MNPTGEKWMDGITLSPHELMFVKVKDYLLLSTNSLAITAAKYSDWMDGLVRRRFPFQILFVILSRLASQQNGNQLWTNHFATQVA